MNISPPRYDENGLNILDPHDKLGFKSTYINMLHEAAIERYLPVGDNKKICLDVGCGYGRLTSILNKRNWCVIGIEPDFRLVTYANTNHPNAFYVQGKLPQLPIASHSVDLVVLQNVLRPLFLLNMLDCVRGIGKLLSNSGTILVTENIRQDDKRYVSEKKLKKIFSDEGFTNCDSYSIRLGRWWPIYFIRYGFIPKAFLPAMSKYEIIKRSKSYKIPHWTYVTKMFFFKSDSEL